MIKQSYLEIFVNSNGNVTIRYAMPNKEQLINVDMIEIHPEDLIDISVGLADIAEEV